MKKGELKKEIDKQKNTFRVFYLLGSFVLSSGVYANICNRTPQIKEEILEQIKQTRFLKFPIRCENVKKKHLKKSKY